MRIARLRLDGFKSFVDQTELAILEGLTGVVGPNGCGKSNLLEALRWAMGENRPTAMRGGGMDDVIFAGAASRPARAWAEVALTLEATGDAPPAAWQGAPSVEVVRRIARDAGSTYRVAGREVRARDVQLLFADASTGAHSPALVRQGQIAELIGTKPQRRRRVLEEAAGIVGLHQRREEAIARLAATEANLARLDDVIEALAQRLAALGRQARQAARYREVAEALRAAEGLALLGRWRMAGEAGEAAAADFRKRESEADAAARAAIAAEAAREQAEAAVPAMREAEAVAEALVARVAGRTEVLDAEARQARETVAAAESRLGQIEADAAREVRLAADAEAAIDALRREAEELAAAGRGHEAALTSALQASAAADEGLRAGEAGAQALAEKFARLSALHGEAGRRLEGAGRRRRTLAVECDVAGRATDAARLARDEAGAEVVAAAGEARRTHHAAEAAEAAAAAADAARDAAEAKEGLARLRRAEAEGVHAALAAEARTVARILEERPGAAEALIARVHVREGDEDAFAAAMGDDLDAGEAGPADAVGWMALPPFDALPTLPEGATPLAARVDAPAPLARRLSLVGLVAANAGAALQPALGPGQVLVSQDGDLWRWDGYRAVAGAATSAVARHLRQVNRLAALRDELSEADRAAAAARSEHEALGHALARARDAAAEARARSRDAERSATEADRRLRDAEARRAGADGRQDAAAATLRHLEVEAAEAEIAWTAAETEGAALEPLGAARDEWDAARAGVDAARRDAAARREAAEALRRAGEARERRAERVAAELDSWLARGREAASRRSDLDKRLRTAREELDAARRRPAEVAAQLEALARDRREADARRTATTAARAAGEEALRNAIDTARLAERRAGAAREARAGAQARRDAAGEALRAAEQRILESTGAMPAQLARALGAATESLVPPEAAEARAMELRRIRDAMGPVNLRAEADAAEARRDHETLAAERSDLAQAVAELRSGVAALNREGRQRLLDAFEMVDANFSLLFRHLFRGGTARLALVESDDPLEAGLELLCQPPGKKLASLSLLSGGEQTLTALALIFAVFLANPAPICVLDEVDAPLDDANVARFCDMLDEMTRRTETRFLVITHHAVTMARMDRLYGVTMVEQGVSQLVSVDLGRAEALVA